MQNKFKKMSLRVCLEPLKVKGKKLYRMESLLGVGLPLFGTPKKECGMINFGGSYTKKTFGPNLRRKDEEIIQIISWTFMPLLW
jgi:hypothetical protein